MKISVVLGAGFGDEGKGNFVNHLCKENPEHTLVVRFNGGQQAGHTVVHNGQRHVFSNFGSGTLQGVPTYWSKYCTVYPMGFNREYDALQEMGIQPMISFDPMCPVTTPYDILCGRTEESSSQHGSCGAGFGKTVWRHETLDHSYRIFVKDLANEWILQQKLNALAAFYGLDIDIEPFVQSAKQMYSRIDLIPERWAVERLFPHGHLIFEGAQGILLDREHGIFPNVTRSHTTSKNVFEILNRHGFADVGVGIYYMTRCYSTRHGNGPFFPDSISVNNPDETNKFNEWQGEFKIAPFYYPNLQYAIQSDFVYNVAHVPYQHIVVTCMDQLDEYPVYMNNGEIDKLNKDDFMGLFSAYDTIFVDKSDF